MLKCVINAGVETRPGRLLLHLKSLIGPTIFWVGYTTFHSLSFSSDWACFIHEPSDFVSLPGVLKGDCRGGASTSIFCDSSVLGQICASEEGLAGKKLRAQLKIDLGISSIRALIVQGAVLLRWLVLPGWVVGQKHGA